MTNKQKLFLALNIGKKAEESEIQEFKRYIGVSPVYVVAVNPTKAEQEKLYPNIHLDAEPEYVTTNENGEKIFRLEFHVKTDPEWGNKIDNYARIRFFISEQVNVNRDNTKCQVIDEFGETCWVTKEQYKAQQRPDTSKVYGEYRPCHRGEADLYAFLKCWLNIDDSMSYNRDANRWEPTESAKNGNAKIKLDWSALCKGDVKDLKDVIKQAKDYKVKVCFGIRTTSDNRHYQDVCNKVFLKNSSNYYLRFDKSIQNLKQSGMYADTVFSSENLKEWTVESTEFTNTITGVPNGSSDIFNNNISSSENRDLLGSLDGNDLPF